MSTSTITRVDDPVDPEPGVETPRGIRSHREVLWVGLIAVVAGATHLPFLTSSLGPDEGGFLMVAGQWSPGNSLYGDYWVDRPPLLIAFYALADHLGGPVALRVLGIAAIVISVLAAGMIGGRVGRGGAGDTDRRASVGAVSAALAAAIFLANPLFGTALVNGELISVAAILSAMAVGLVGARASAPTRARWWVLAGVLAASAMFIKQNQIDAFIFLAGLSWAAARQAAKAQRLRQLRRDLGALALGALASVAVLIAVADLRGTTPPALWDAMVTFRVEASAVLQSYASPTNTGRLWRLLGALVLSGAPLLVVPLLGTPRSSTKARIVGHDLRWVALAVLAWEGISVAGGGSYWLHYLICLVPGLVLAVSVLTASRGAESPSGTSRTVRVVSSPRLALTYCALACAVAFFFTVVGAAQRPTEAPTSAWLAAHSSPGDTGLVAYGQPNILAEAGLDSPYPYLWSLVVRVKDPDLALLSTTLAGKDRPDWVITGPAGLHEWQIDPTTGDEQLAMHYRPVATVEGNVIYLQNSRDLA